MNKVESLALHTQGREAWNEWAKARLADRQALEAAGDWVAGLDKSTWNEAARKWHAAAVADFSGHEFAKAADFTAFRFPGDAWFGDATFSGHARFGGTTFSGDAWFNSTTFSGDAGFVGAKFFGNAEFDGATFSVYAWFSDAAFSGSAGFGGATFSGDALFGDATFSGHARFDGAKFSGGARFGGATFAGRAGFDGATFAGDVWFGGTTFSGDAAFVQAVFKDRTNFDAARFETQADFSAVQGSASFSLKEARFYAVPDFIEANFNQAPRLDNLRIERVRSVLSFRERARKYFKGDPDLSARWRALKRLAVQGLDHEQELIFFKEELRSRRWIRDKFWHPAFWLGLAYQILSDFGRSAVRPLLFWVAGIAGFSGLYLGQFPTLAAKPFLGFPWALDWVWSYWTEGPYLSCVAGLGNPVSAAFQLSLRKALLFFGLDSTDKLNQIYACLYGVHGAKTTTAGPLPSGFVPVIPDTVALLNLLQLVLSAVLVFLILLALRNHFRIK